MGITDHWCVHDVTNAFKPLSVCLCVCDGVLLSGVYRRLDQQSVLAAANLCSNVGQLRDFVDSASIYSVSSLVITEILTDFMSLFKTNVSLSFSLK